MPLHSPYRVVGLRADGERVMLSRHETQDIADLVMSLLSLDSDFRSFFVEKDGDDQITHPPAPRV